MRYRQGVSSCVRGLGLEAGGISYFDGEDSLWLSLKEGLKYDNKFWPKTRESFLRDVSDRAGGAQLTRFTLKPTGYQMQGVVKV